MFPLMCSKEDMFDVLFDDAEIPSDLDNRTDEGVSIDDFIRNLSQEIFDPLTQEARKIKTFADRL